MRKLHLAWDDAFQVSEKVKDLSLEDYRIRDLSAFDIAIKGMAHQIWQALVSDFFPNNPIDIYYPPEDEYFNGEFALIGYKSYLQKMYPSNVLVFLKKHELLVDFEIYGLGWQFTGYEFKKAPWQILEGILLVYNESANGQDPHLMKYVESLSWREENQESLESASYMKDFIKLVESKNIRYEITKKGSK